MTKQEAAAALGVAVTGPSEKTSGDTSGRGSSVSSCGYNGPGAQAINLTVARLLPALAPKFKDSCLKQTRDGLEGLGDLACWYNDKHQELHAFKGTTFLSLQLRRNGDTTEVIKGVMKKALARLK